MFLGLMIIQQSAGASSRDIFDYLIQIGMAGIIILLALIPPGYIWFWPSVRRIIERSDRIEQQRDDLIKSQRDEILPVLTEAVRVLSALAKEEQKRTIREELERQYNQKGQDGVNPNEV